MKTNTDFNKLWITSPTDCGAAAYTLKKEFFTEGTVKNAVLNTSAMGIYVPFINGKRIGRNVLTPGWTSYNNRIQYQSYDITPYLEKENTLAITVGQGWAVGYIGHHHMNHIYADRASVVAWVEITYDNTTMWEHWNGIKEDGSFWSKNMNSFNHYAYGAVYDWIFGVAAGIKPVENAPGYKEITVSPHPHKDLGFCDASIESRSGFIRSYWYYKNDTVYYEFEIPEGVTAYLTLPSGYRETLNGGKYIFTDSHLSVNSR